jgi:hypothetical protein
MKNDDFLAGDRICTPILSDTADNVCFAPKNWIPSQQYLTGDTVSHLGIVYKATQNSNSVNSPVVNTGDWTKDNSLPEAKCMPSIIYAVGAGDIKFTTYNGDVDTLAVAALSFLLAGKIRVRRVWATGTTATGIRAIAE